MCFAREKGTGVIVLSLRRSAAPKDLVASRGQASRGQIRFTVFEITKRPPAAYVDTLFDPFFARMS